MKPFSFQHTSSGFIPGKRLLLASALALLLSGCDGVSSSGWLNNGAGPGQSTAGGDDTGPDTPPVPEIPTVIEANIDNLVTKIGGATQDVAPTTTAVATGHSTPWPIALRQRRWA